MNSSKKGGPDRAVFEREIEKLMESQEIRRMEQFGQHSGNNTLQHVRNVAFKSFELAQKLGWDIDEKVLARGAILHDYYLYTCVNKHGIKAYKHGTGHPGLALKNARKDFELTEKEENIIESHMWPLTLFHMPKSREAFLVCMADKYCAANEMLLHRNNLEGKKQ